VCVFNLEKVNGHSAVSCNCRYLMPMSCSVTALTPLDIAACYADYHVYNAVNTKLQSLPPDKDKDKKKKKPDKKAVVRRPGADLYQQKLTGKLSKTSRVCQAAIFTVAR